MSPIKACRGTTTRCVTRLYVPITHHHPHSSLYTDSIAYLQRFAYYTTIPSLIVQVLLLGLALYAIFIDGPKTRGLRLDEEKDHELGRVHQQSFETKMESPKSAPDSVNIVSAGRGKFL